MSRRTLALLALALTASSLTACAASVTAPERAPINPGAAFSRGTIDSGSCRGGWVSSQGRCG